MDKKIKTALVATAAAFTAFSVHQVSADEESDKTANKETTEVETLKPVSDKQIADAEKKVLDIKETIKQKEANLTQAEADAKVATEKEKAAAEKAKEATPEAIQKAKDKATIAAEAVKTAEADVKTKKAAQDALAKNVAPKQTEADKANSAVDAAAKKVQDLENGTPSLTEAEKAKAEAEKAKAEAEKAKAEAEKAKTEAEKAKADAKKADDAADKKVTDLNKELSAKKQTLADKEKALKDLGEKPQAYDFSDVTFTLFKGFAAALNKRAELMGENDPNNTGDGRANQLSTRPKAEVTANAEKLKELAKINMAKNTYTNTTDTRPVDIWNLTADQKTEINLFGLHIVNQIREQLGNPKVKTTVGMEKFANEAAENRNKKYGKVTETYAKPDYDGINAAAKANGLSYKTGDNQNQSDIIFANAKTYEKTTESELFKSEQNLNTLIQNSTRRPTMTMGQLKEYIFEAYNNKMFTNNEDYTGANSHRAWENALSIGGSIAYRKDGEGNKLGRKASEYNATSVTASVKFNPQAHVNKWGHRYFNNLEIFVHNFQTAGENKEPGQDTNSIVRDPAKFNATEIKNDPTAAKEYSAKKQAAEKAVKDAQAEVTTAQSNLDTAKQYKNQLPAAEKVLTDATSKLTAADKALQEAETNLKNLRQGLTNKAAELNKAKASLKTAKQEADKAKTALTEAKAKLAQAEKDVKDSEANVKTKEAEKAKAEELVASLENAKENYAKAKADKEAADAKVTELHKCIADKQTELVTLEEEYKDLLKRRISNLVNENPEKPELTFTEEVKEEEIKFNVVEELDPSLKEGERVVKTPGVVGRKKIKATIFKVDGKEVGSVVDSEEVLTKAIDEVVLVGTKKEVSPILPEKLPPRKEDKKPEVNKPEANKPEVKPDREKTLPREEVKDEKQDSKPAVSDDAKKLAEQAISNSQVSYMAPKATQSVVYVENAKKLPTTGMKDSKASIVLAIIAATTSLGLVARKKEEK
ncbi:SEC10/PgrA surface exclusion domain-containing protein [Streptococcus mitis]|uniref:SEC10/PgrA surface exclusion domain-containing protein n=1 Tax=Streptococcus mitis TaxID=28037 RepID=UPI0022B7D224|nr:SEC10/PgrA surface exclusion domain-containing protein [Streptococcus mitis]